MKKITLYCDGSSLGNPGFGGWCAILTYQNNKKILSGGEASTTNNRMELRAVIEGLKAIKEKCNVSLVSDSKYVCEGINSWLKNWIKKDFKNVKNIDLWREYLQVSQQHIIEAIWVKGHSGHIENEECDRIAKEEANKFKSGVSKNGAIKNVESKIIESKKPLIKSPKKASKSLNNKLDSKSRRNAARLESLQENIKYFFRDEALLKTALTHKSYNRSENNERLEFLGDAVLDLLIGEYVFRKLESSNEGDLTKLRASLVNESSFAKLARAIRLGEFIFISNSEERNLGRDKNSILSDAFEALIGAVYLDGGIDNAKSIAYHLLEEVYKEIDLDNLFVDYKTSLQELTQLIFGSIPQYELISTKGPDHNKEFLMQIKINNEVYASASGRSKKEAEQHCAKMAFDRLKKR